jgi:hypothetical protein
MSRHRQRGTTFVVGLMLLAVVTLLGLAGAGSARVELQLARNEQFRENAASAASAGIEYAIHQIVTTSEFDAVPPRASELLPGSTDRYEVVTRFVGYEAALPQAGAELLAGAHFEITSTGFSARRAIDRQRSGVMLVVPAPEPTTAPACAPAAAGVHCFARGELVRLWWQREAVP